MRRFVSLFLVLLILMPAAGWASVFDPEKQEETTELPQELDELENLSRETDGDGLDEQMDTNIRLKAMKEAALSYGARGGLAWQTYHIRQTLDQRAVYLDKVFDFGQLLIPAPSGLLIEPPIITESDNAMIIDNGGLEAAIADRIYDINANVKIVSAPRDWRNYLERIWGEVEPPPDILRPRDYEERQKWREWVRKGWREGIEQANLIFEVDLNQLLSHYNGMVRYRTLLAQGMVSQPFALQVDRGVTGGGDSMRVGDRAIQITGVPELKPEADKWRPVNR